MGGKSCIGFQVHVSDPKIYAVSASLALLQAAILLYPQHFKYKQPPYEYEFERCRWI